MPLWIGTALLAIAIVGLAAQLSRGATTAAMAQPHMFAGVKDFGRAPRDHAALSWAKTISLVAVTSMVFAIASEYKVYS